MSHSADPQGKRAMLRAMLRAMQDKIKALRLQLDRGSYCSCLGSGWYPEQEGMPCRDVEARWADYLEDQLINGNFTSSRGDDTRHYQEFRKLVGPMPDRRCWRKALKRGDKEAIELMACANRRKTTNG